MAEKIKLQRKKYLYENIGLRDSQRKREPQRRKQ